MIGSCLQYMVGTADRGKSNNKIFTVNEEYLVPMPESEDVV